MKNAFDSVRLGGVGQVIKKLVGGNEIRELAFVQSAISFLWLYMIHQKKIVEAIFVQLPNQCTANKSGGAGDNPHGDKIRDL